MKGFMGKATDNRTTVASVCAAILTFAILTGLNVVIFRGMEERDRLESRNDAERTMNVLLAGLRDHDNFGAAIENVASLKQKVVGVAAYAVGGERIYSWGLTPDTLVTPVPAEEQAGATVSKYMDNPQNDSVVLLFRPFIHAPPPPRENETEGEAARKNHPKPSGFLFTTLKRAEIVYLEIREPTYWRNHRIESMLFPFIELSFLALELFVFTILRRNAEYRRRIEEQKNLVVLGTAASTLAHEIKNPLLSIKLQTRILEKTTLPDARREIDIINDEVDRLSALSHRVGDFLREPAGNPHVIDPSIVAREVGLRLCGRDILRASGVSWPQVYMDPERLRSVLENLLRNALEAEGPEDGVEIEIGEDAGRVRLDVLDRGTGLSSTVLARLYDPFFTTKSRGTGIGLSVCRRFVLAAGGSLALEPRSGGGCRARVLIPGMEA